MRNRYEVLSVIKRDGKTEVTVLATTRRFNGAVNIRDERVDSERVVMVKHSSQSGRVVQGTDQYDPNAVVVIMLNDRCAIDQIRTFTIRDARPFGGR